MSRDYDLARDMAQERQLVEAEERADRKRAAGAGRTTPSDFPVMRTVREWNAIYRGRRGYHVCPVCRLAVEPRNSRAHAKACARRKREAPALWREWRDDMYGVTR